MQFSGTADYIADKDLMIAVNAAIRLERPLLVKGEPGTGKTELAIGLSDAEAKTNTFLECVAGGQEAPLCALQADPDYQGFNTLPDTPIQPKG